MSLTSAMRAASPSTPPAPRTRSSASRSRAPPASLRAMCASRSGWSTSTTSWPTSARRWRRWAEAALVASVRKAGWVAIAIALAFGGRLEADPLTEQPRSTIGYPTPDAALAALHAKPDVEFSTQDGWTIASDPETNTVWSFPPQRDPAYPAVVKRQMTPAADGKVAV